MEQNFGKMKITFGIKVLKFSIEKVWKKVLENVWDPWLV